eukprot:TRINITY_DN2798_c0_g1_i17.p1 TRINITY_DN2798_c0_g1~~TRINITY_DN2798_c0_g1_i17.p1  ORF type:complete len:322 (+),score=27.84 TRINITY_DN2798_c0_g1_i17:79-1044(+)
MINHQQIHLSKQFRVPAHLTNCRNSVNRTSFRVMSVATDAPTTLSQKRKYKTDVIPTESRETQIEKVADRTWTFTQPFFDALDKVNGEIDGSLVFLRMTFYKLKDGSYFVHNPIAPTQELIELIEQNVPGKIKYAVVGGHSSEHSNFLPDFCIKLKQEPAVWVTQSLYDKITIGEQKDYEELLSRGMIQVIKDGQSWDDEVEAKNIYVSKDFGEAQFLLKDDRVVLTTDYAVGFNEGGGSSTPFLDYLLGYNERLSPVFGRLGWISEAIKQRSLAPRQEFIDFLKRVCTWDFDHVIPSHFDLFMNNGKKKYMQMVNEYYGK